MCETASFNSFDVHDQGLVGDVEKRGSLFSDISKEAAAFVFVIKGSSVVEGEPSTFFFRNVGSHPCC